MNDFISSRQSIGESMITRFIKEGNRAAIEKIKIQAEFKELPEVLTLWEIAVLSEQDPDQFKNVVLGAGLKTVQIEKKSGEKTYFIDGATSSAYRSFLESKRLWPVSEKLLLANWWAEDEKPWLIPNPSHPPADHQWWTPARYFAAQHKRANPDYGIDKLWPLVQLDLKEKNIFAQGKKNEPPGEAAIKKALGKIPELKKNIQ